MLTEDVIKSSQVITEELCDWIILQAKAGYSGKAVLQAMQVSGWEPDVALSALEAALKSLQVEKVEPAPLPPPMPVPEPQVKNSPTSLDAGDRRVQLLMSMQQPRVVVFGNLLSHEECDELVKLAATRMTRSEVIANQTGGSEIQEIRTSFGMFFSREENEICARIERRIAKLLTWPLENGEGLQVLNYKPGAEYRPHYDYFATSGQSVTSLLKRGGQRVGTLVMYLNSPDEGGGTTFPDVGLEVAPIKGNAVFFSYDRAHASTKTLHGGAPVVTGEKWVATKWLRQRQFE
jgi:prolyl 4-hydroxylase